MTAPGNEIIVGLLGVFTALCTAYACGRLHQSYRQTCEREDAFQRGYDRASYSMFHLAARVPSHKEQATARGTEQATPARHRRSINAGQSHVYGP